MSTCIHTGIGIPECCCIPCINAILECHGKSPVTVKNAVTQKRCPVCNEWKPLDQYYVRRSGRSKGEPQSYCKRCSNRKRVEDRKAAEAYKEYLSRPNRPGRSKLANYKPPIPEDHKECAGCKKVKPLDDFYRNHRAKDGRQNRCKECFDARRREGVAQQPIPKRKACSSCKQNLPIEQFWYSSTQGYQGYCKDCHNSYTTQWRKENWNHIYEQRKARKRATSSN